MKKSIVIVLLLMVSLSADLSVQQIQEMVIKIHQKREGIKLETLEKTKEPFIGSQEKDNLITSDILKKDDEEETKLSVHALVNGKAYINDGWKSVNDKVLGYKVEYIGKRGVVLRNGNNIKKLFISKKRDDFIKVEEK